MDKIKCYNCSGTGFIKNNYMCNNCNGIKCINYRNNYCELYSLCINCYGCGYNNQSNNECNICSGNGYISNEKLKKCHLSEFLNDNTNVNCSICNDNHKLCLSNNIQITPYVLCDKCNGDGNI